MVKCEKCVIYNPEYDNLQRSYNDVLKGGKINDCHFCALFENGIPLDVNPGGGDCEYFTESEVNKDEMQP